MSPPLSEHSYILLVLVRLIQALSRESSKLSLSERGIQLNKLKKEWQSDFPKAHNRISGRIAIAGLILTDGIM